jgi:hypothetical protein
VSAALKLSGLTASQFTPALSVAFAASVAAAASVPASDVAIVSVADAPAQRWRLLQAAAPAASVVVRFTIAVRSGGASGAAALSSAVVALPWSPSFNVQLATSFAAAGVSAPLGVTIAEPPAVVENGRAAASPPAAPPISAVAGARGTSGAATTLLAALLAAVACM